MLQISIAGNFVVDNSLPDRIELNLGLMSIDKELIISAEPLMDELKLEQRQKRNAN